MRNAMHIGPSAGSRDRRQALVLAVTGRIVRPNPAKPLHDSCAARLTPRTHKRGRRDGGKRSQSGAASRPGASTAKATSTHEGPRQGGRPASSTGACRDGPARGRAHTVRPPPPLFGRPIRHQRHSLRSSGTAIQPDAAKDETSNNARTWHSGYSADLPQRRVASQPGASMAKTTPTHEGPRGDGRPASSTGACRDRPARGAEYARPPPQSRDQRQHWC